MGLRVWDPRVFFWGESKWLSITSEMHFPTRRQFRSVPGWRQKNENKMVGRNCGDYLGQLVFTVPFARVCFFWKGVAFVKERLTPEKVVWTENECDNQGRWNFDHGSDSLWVSILIVWVIASDFPLRVLLVASTGRNLFAVSRGKLRSMTEIFYGLHTRMFSRHTYQVIKTIVRSLFDPLSVE